MLRDLDNAGLLDADEDLLEMAIMLEACESKARLDRREPGSECGGERGRRGELDAVRYVSVVE